jgi:hypothetical protein
MAWRKILHERERQSSISGGGGGGCEGGGLELGSLYSGGGDALAVDSESGAPSLESFVSNPMLAQTARTEAIAAPIAAATGAAAGGGGGGEHAEGRDEREALLARFNRIEATMEGFESRHTGLDTDVRLLSTVVEGLQQQRHLLPTSGSVTYSEEDDAGANPNPTTPGCA